MKYTENAINVLTIKTFKGIGDAWINKNLKNKVFYEDMIELLKKEKIKEEFSEKIS